MRQAGVAVSAHRSAQRAQVSVDLVDPHRDRQEVGHRSGEALSPGDRHHVAGAQMVEHPRQFRPVTIRPGCFFLKDADAAGRAEGGALLVQVLAAR